MLTNEDLMYLKIKKSFNELLFLLRKVMKAKLQVTNENRFKKNGIKETHFICLKKKKDSV